MVESAVESGAGETATGVAVIGTPSIERRWRTHAHRTRSILNCFALYAHRSNGIGRMHDDTKEKRARPASHPLHDNRFRHEAGQIFTSRRSYRAARPSSP